MINPIKVIQLGKAFLSLVKDPNQLEMVFRLSDKVDTVEALSAVAETFSATAHGRRALATRFRVGTVDLQKLIHYAPGTLGYEFAKHMLDRNLKIEDIPSLPGEDALQYVKAHLYETHDIWHVVTGFETDVAGELGLQAFYLAQLPTPLSCFLLSSSFLNTAVHRMDERHARMNEITRGWDMGKTCQPLAGMPWHERWTQPLAEIRKDLGIHVSLRIPAPKAAPMASNQ